jgi:NADH-quinone oxidoreductase subunit C
MTDPPNPPEAPGGTEVGEGRPEPLAGAVPRAAQPKAAASPPGAGKPAEPTRTLAAPTGPTDPPPPPGVPVPQFISALQDAQPGAVEHISLWVGDWAIVVPASRLTDAATHLRDAEGALFDFCSDVTATDWPPRPQRFDVVYSLYSTRLRHRLRLKVRIADNETVPTVSAIWPAANWLEREVFDLFGIRFDGHPDLRRILMPDEWQGHPQRKDYPLEGPGELLLENPMDWLRVKRAQDIE